MSKTRKKRRAAPVQHAQIKVRLLTAYTQVLFQIPGACNKQQTFELIEEELSTKYPDKQYVKTGVQFSDGRFEADTQLASGGAFAQQEAVICFQPTAGEQLPLMEQITQHLQKQRSLCSLSQMQSLRPKQRSKAESMPSSASLNCSG